MAIFTKEILEQGRGTDGAFNDIQFRIFKIYEYVEQNLLDKLGKEVGNGKIQRFLKFQNFHIKHKNYNTPKAIARAAELRAHKAKKRRAKKLKNLVDKISKVNPIKNQADKITVIKAKKNPENS